VGGNRRRGMEKEIREKIGKIWGEGGRTVKVHRAFVLHQRLDGR